MKYKKAFAFGKGFIVFFKLINHFLFQVLIYGI